MKTLSIKNPYGYQIIYGVKDIENRTWKTNFRGRFLVHTSGITMIDILDKYYPEAFWKLSDEYFKFYDAGQFDKAEEFLNKYPALRKMDILEDAINKAKEERELYLQRGCIIGSVELFDIVKNSKSPFAEKNCYHWILKNPVLFDHPIVNIKGKLNLWDFDYVEGEPVPGMAK